MSRTRIAGFRLGVYIFKDAGLLRCASIRSRTRRLSDRGRRAACADTSWPDRPAELRLSRWPGHGCVPDSGRLRHETRDAQPPTPRIRSCPATVDTAHECVHRILDLREHGSAQRPLRHEPQGARSHRSIRLGKVPIDRLAEIAPACRISRARVVDAGRIVTAGGIASGIELGFHLLRRAGYDEAFISEVARVMEYHRAYELYRGDLEVAVEPARVSA
jgi:hypothetical protein